MTPPERRRQEVSTAGTPESRPAHDAHHQNSGGTSHPPEDSEQTTDEVRTNGSGAVNPVQRTPSRGGIWEWARAGSGRLSIIGRLPHPEWKGPATAKALSELAVNGTPENGTIVESQDDFSIPGTTAMEPENEEQQLEVAAAKLEGLGIANGNTIMSPSFAQTKRSSDELVAASSTASTPANLAMSNYGGNSTPSAASRDSPPSTPDTPTPQQRRRDTPTELENTPTKDAPNQSTSSEPKSKTTDMSTEGTPKEAKLKDGDAATNGNGTPAKLKSVKKDASSPHPIPKYKIALNASLLSPARGTAST